MPPRYLQEFRAQYPGAYDDVPDRNLARALIKKDPIRWTPLVGDLVMAQQQPPGPGTTNLTTTDVLRGVGKGADFGLPLIGAMGGGAVGMPMGPGGAMLGGGLGGALGQQGANVVNQLISGIDPAAAQPRSLLEQAGRSAEAGLTGMQGEGVGQLAIGAGRRFATRGMSNADIGFMQDAARFGIPTTAGERTLSPSIGMAESYPGRFPLGVGPVEKFARARRLKTQGAAEEIGAKFGGPADLQTAGTTIKSELEDLATAQISAAEESVMRFVQGMGRPKGRVELGETFSRALRRAQETRRAQASEIYEQAATEFGDAKAPATNLYGAAKQLTGVESTVPGVQGRTASVAGGVQKRTGPAPVDPADMSPEQLMELARAGAGQGGGLSFGGPLALQDLPAEFVRKYGLDKPQPLTFANLREYQQRLSGLIRVTQDDFTKRKLKGLFDAVSTDIDQMGAGAETLRQANRFYKDEVAQYFGRRTFVRDLMDMSEKDRMVERLMGVDSPTQVRQIMRVIPADLRATYQASFVQRLHDEGLDAATGQWSPTRFLRAANAYSDDTLKELLGGRYAEFGKLRGTLQRQAAKESSDPLFGQIARADEPAVLGKFLRKHRAEDVQTVFGNLSEPGKQQARRAAWDDILGRSVDPQTNAFSHGRFLTRVNEIDDKTWKAFLGDDAFESLGQLRRVLQRIQTSGRIGENPSQTARGVGTMSQMTGATGLAAGSAVGKFSPGQFTVTAVTLASPWLFGKFLMSKRGIDLLTKGVLARPGTEQAIRVGSQMAAFIARESGEPSP